MSYAGFQQNDGPQMLNLFMVVGLAALCSIAEGGVEEMLRLGCCPLRP